MHLILDTFGTSLVKKDDLFMVIHRDGKQAIATRQIKTISLSKGARISSDAIMMAIEHEIDILFIDHNGQPQGRVWSHRYGSISNIRKNQVFFSRSPQAVSWVREIILQKMKNQTALLASWNRASPDVQEAIAKIEASYEKVSRLEADMVHQIADTLRGLEGFASQVYFTCIAKLLPVAYRFAKRSQHPAQDMFNSMLNYAYGMLYGKIEGALIKAGLDPYLGILHRNEYNRPVLVYDVIENFRIWADQVVINLCRQEVVCPDFFQVTEKGWWLGCEGKRLLIQSMNDYLEEIVGMRGKSRTRSTHIEIFAQEMAGMLKDYTHL